MDALTRRRLLAVLVAVTVVLLVSDLAGTGLAAGVRRASATVLGPVQRALSGAREDELARALADNTRLRTIVAAQTRELADLARLRELLGSDPARAHTLVAARVVATDVSALGGRSVTLDVGSHDGVVIDSTVLTGEGLVGRVIAVAPWTCDVQVIGSTGSTVGVRVGPAGTLGTVTAPQTSDVVARPRGTLGLTLIRPGTPVVGDLVTTLGSVDGRPYAAGILVGSVESVDPDSVQTGAQTGALPGAQSGQGGLGTHTATVRPVIDADALDIVGVLVPLPRATPRPSAPPSAGPR